MDGAENKLKEKSWHLSASHSTLITAAQDISTFTTVSRWATMIIIIDTVLLYTATVLAINWVSDQILNSNLLSQSTLQFWIMVLNNGQKTVDIIKMMMP